MNESDLEGWLQQERLPGEYRDLVRRLHEPLAGYVARLCETSDRVVVVGVSGCQGSGKSTLSRLLACLLAARQIPAAALSLDDFYLRHAQRQALATQVHPLFVTRGVPGTHDVPLALAVLQELAAGRSVRVPSFDKARDDRAPENEWPHVGPTRVVLFEGWCVGARAQSAADLNQPVNELETREDDAGVWRRAVNDALARDYQTLFAQLDRLIFLQAPSFDVVLRWRLEQEQKLRAQRSEGDQPRVMDRAQLERFIAHYERLTRHMLLTMPAHANVLVRLDEHRQVIDLMFKHE